jgi:N-acetylglucosamine repressor
MKLVNINNEKMKEINLKVVLNSIRQKEPISRKELAELVGLTSSSITNIVNRLIKEGYLIETGSGESNGGRKPIMLELNSSGRYAIGVELNTSQIVCLMTDFKTNVIMKKEADTLIDEGKDRVIQRILNLIQEMIAETAILPEKIMGIGFVSAGPYDHEKGIMINPPNFPGWYNVPIKELIQKATGIPTLFEKETVAAAVGECWFGQAAEVKSLFVIDVYNVGIGGGVIIDGQIYHGYCDGAGDLGHMVIDLEGPLCSCGNYGCLESVASGIAVERNVKSEIRRGETSLLNTGGESADHINIEMIIKAASDGDLLCKRIIEKSARYLGIAISNLINVYSPEMIIIGGPFAGSCPFYVEVAIEHARKRTYPLYNKDVKIFPSLLGDEQGARGGIGLVFNEFYRKLDTK